MTNNEEEQHHRNALLHIHYGNVRKLEQQIAQYGVSPPLHLCNALDHERRMIAELEGSQSLASGLTVPATAVRPPPAESALPRHKSAAMQPYRSSLARMRGAPVSHTKPSLGQIAWRTKTHALRWWQAGGIAFVLAVCLIGFLLWRPAPNAVLVDQIRSKLPSTVSQTILIGENALEPARIEARVGTLVVLTITNQTNSPQRWLLIDGDTSTAQRLLADSLPDPAQVRRATALLQPGEQASLTFVPPDTGSYSFVSVNQRGEVGQWGVIEIRERLP